MLQPIFAVFMPYAEHAAHSRIYRAAGEIICLFYKQHEPHGLLRYGYRGRGRVVVHGFQARHALIFMVYVKELIQIDEPPVYIVGSFVGLRLRICVQRKLRNRIKAVKICVNEPLWSRISAAKEQSQCHNGYKRDGNKPFHRLSSALCGGCMCASNQSVRSLPAASLNAAISLSFVPTPI